MQPIMLSSSPSRVSVLAVALAAGCIVSVFDHESTPWTFSDSTQQQLRSTVWSNNPKTVQLKPGAAAQLKPGAAVQLKPGTAADGADCITFKCSKDVRVCNNALPTNYAGPDAPCCTHLLRAMAREFDAKMLRLGLEYFVSWGTLLGMTQLERMVPWMTDNDFVASGETAAAMKMSWDPNGYGISIFGEGNPAQLCINYHFARGGGGGLWEKWSVPTPKNKKHRQGPKGKPIYIWLRGILYSNFYISRIYADCMLVGHIGHCSHPYSDIFLIKQTRVYDDTFTLSFPRKPEQLLQHYYGLDWMTPPKEHNGH